MKTKMFAIALCVGLFVGNTSCSKEERDVLDCVYRGDCDDFETDQSAPDANVDALDPAGATTEAAH